MVCRVRAEPLPSARPSDVRRLTGSGHHAVSPGIASDAYCRCVANAQPLRWLVRPGNERWLLGATVLAIPVVAISSLARFGTDRDGRLARLLRVDSDRIGQAGFTFLTIGGCQVVALLVVLGWIALDG